MDIKEKRSKVPEVDRTALEPAPFVIAIVGPPSVGKSTLMQNLIKNYTRQKLNNIKGPVTVVTNKNRRLTIIECNNDLNSMIDIAKVADLVLLMIDASFGFEMETFEFLNICQVHGFPRIMGVLTHMDLLTNSKQLKKTKKKLKHRFWTEIYQGAKLFYLTGIVNGEYRKHEIHNLARFISVMKFKDLGYRANHSFVIADRIEDITQPDLIRQNEKCDRTICFYGYVRGCALKKNANIHIPGNGDYQISDISFLSDPCPLPDKEKKRTLDDRERLLYAPFSGVGGLVYDKDAVYIELGGSHSYNVGAANGRHVNSENKRFFDNIISSKKTIDSKLMEAKLKLFSNSDENQTFLEQNEDDVLTEQVVKSEVEPRIRKKVKFFDHKSDDENEDEEEKDSEESEQEIDSELEDEEDDDNDLKWRENLKLNAKLNFEKHSNVNWNSLIYGKESQIVDQKPINTNNNSEENDFFTVKKSNLKNESLKQDNTKYETQLKEFDAEKVSEEFDSIKDCFVTGKWEKDKDAAHLLNQDDDEFGDFVDLEENNDEDDEKEDFDEDDDEEEDENDEENDNGEVTEQGKRKTRNEMTKRERLLAKKRRLKKKFNNEFDSNKVLDKDGIPQDSYYDALNEEADRQTNLNRLEFEKMDDSTRVEYEGFKCGLYVRCEIKNIPAEFMTKFDASYLTILGSLVTNESNIGCVQVRLKKHRWYKKILKAKNPLIVSLGWRRFQTIPLYFIQDHNMRNRYLKYTPQHMYCHAAFWGPITPPNTGFIAFESLSNDNKNFRAAATGVVVDMNKSVQIVKKLKLIGQPLKIFRKTAFITGMFSSVLEASKFEGASIKTVSGIRGQIKKALHASEVPSGSVRATFEDKILASDTIFLRSWFAVSIPKFYTPITNLLTNTHVNVKPLSILKKEKELQIVPNVNSLYKPIEREERVSKPFKVNRHIEEQLPFQFKTKSEANKLNLIDKQRVAIIKEPREAKVIFFLFALN